MKASPTSYIPGPTTYSLLIDNCCIPEVDMLDGMSEPELTNQAASVLKLANQTYLHACFEDQRPGKQRVLLLLSWSI